MSRWPIISRICRGWDFVTMAKQLPYLSRKGFIHDGQSAPVSAEDGTLLRWPSSSSFCRGWDIVTMAKQLPCLSRRKRRKMLEHRFCHDGQSAPVSAEDGTLSRWPISFRICRGWDFVTMAKQLPYLSSMGLCHNVQSAPMSAKNKKKKNVRT